MHRRVILNGKMLDAARARLPLASSAHLHGRGVFTTLAVYAGRPFQWHLHWARLNSHARLAGVDCGRFAATTCRTICFV
jgi:branched-subunit amino acid aminotransferase/4-amino-4-deoxychorismate lyase